MSRAPAAPPELRGFSFVRLLGSGGFSDVYLYDQHLPKRRVAVKVLLSDGLTEANRAAFVAEANLMAQLAHPYIVKIYHADVSDDGRPYIIMEYLSGQNLSEQYKRQPLSVMEALRTGVRLSSAIATAHDAGVLHRDIKPANVLTNDYGWPALTDFGISSALEEDLPSMTTTRAAAEASSGATTGGQSVGMSIPWSPPEMFDEDPKPDVRSDIFSLAATIYTVLAGRTPFEVGGRSNQAVDLMGRIERGAITPMERTDVPPNLLAALRKGMSTDRNARYASAVDFARALQRIELELQYAPTQIDVAGMVVAQPERRVDDNKEDETRARGVTSIAAQAPVSVSPPVMAKPVGAPLDAPPEPAEEHTIVRDSPVDHTVVRGRATPVPIAVVEPATRASRSPLLRVLLIIGAVIVSIVIVIVFVTSLGGGTRDDAADTPDESFVDGGSDPVVSEVVPTPVLESTSTDGSAVVFTWTNPDAIEGDTFVWQRTDGAGDPQRVPTTDPSARIDGFAPGTTVCIDVFVRRGGELSPDPLSVCYQ